MKFQLWTADEYGTGAIIASGTDLNALIKRAKTEVQEVNVNNSLTASEKRRNWEAMYVELVDTESNETIEDAVYGGKDSTGHHAVAQYSAGTKLVKLANCDVKVRIYLGELDGSTWYAADERGKEINSLTHPTVQGKTVYFIRRYG